MTERSECVDIKNTSCSDSTTYPGTDMKSQVECNICKKTFTKSTTLKKHMLTHTTGKQHACDVCKETFTQAENLCVHMLIHTVQKPFECKVCQKTFSHAQNLKTHVRTHTG